MERKLNEDHVESHFKNLPTELIVSIVLLLDFQSMKSLHRLNFGTRVGTAISTAISSETTIAYKRLWSALQVHYAEHQQLIHQYTMVFKHSIDLEFEPIVYPVLPLKCFTLEKVYKIGTLEQRIEVIEKLSLEVAFIKGKYHIYSDNRTPWFQY